MRGLKVSGVKEELFERLIAYARKEARASYRAAIRSSRTSTAAPVPAVVPSAAATSVAAPSAAAPSAPAPSEAAPSAAMAASEELGMLLVLEFVTAGGGMHALCGGQEAAVALKKEGTQAAAVASNPLHPESLAVDKPRPSEVAADSMSCDDVCAVAACGTMNDESCSSDGRSFASCARTSPGEVLCSALGASASYDALMATAVSDESSQPDAADPDSESFITAAFDEAIPMDVLEHVLKSSGEGTSSALETAPTSDASAPPPISKSSGTDGTEEAHGSVALALSSIASSEQGTASEALSPAEGSAELSVASEGSSGSGAYGTAVTSAAAAQPTVTITFAPHALPASPCRSKPVDDELARSRSPLSMLQSLPMAARHRAVAAHESMRPPDSPRFERGSCRSRSPAGGRAPELDAYLTQSPFKATYERLKAKAEARERVDRDTSPMRWQPRPSPLKQQQLWRAAQMPPRTPAASPAGCCAPSVPSASAAPAQLQAPSSPAAVRYRVFSGAAIPERCVALSPGAAQSPIAASPRFAQSPGVVQSPMSSKGVIDVAGDRRRVLEDLTSRIERCLEHLQAPNVDEQIREKYQTRIATIKKQMDDASSVRTPATALASRMMSPAASPYIRRGGC